jgi:hypothetical protein
MFSTPWDEPSRTVPESDPPRSPFPDLKGAGWEWQCGNSQGKIASSNGERKWPGQNGQVKMARSKWPGQNGLNVSVT